MKEKAYYLVLVLFSFSVIEIFFVLVLDRVVVRVVKFSSELESTFNKGDFPETFQMNH